MKNFYISDCAEHENKTVTTFFVVAAKQIKPKKTGQPYLQLTLADRSGQIEAKMWDNVEASVAAFEQGDIVKVEGLVNRYNGRFQFTVHRIRRAEPDEVDAGDFLPKTSKDIGELWSALRGKVASFTDPHLRALLDSFLDDEELAARLRSAPAAKTYHHAMIGGLLEHVVSLVELCDIVAAHYPTIHRDLLLTGAVLHDIGKLEELTYANSFGYSSEGQLLGHITIGIRMLAEKIATLPDFPPRLRTLVEHLVISHHGQYEFGSPKLPMFPEAMMLHMLDDLDAKMYTMTSELERHRAAGNAADSLTDWVRSLERPLIDAHAYAKSGAQAAEAEPEAVKAEAETPAQATLLG
jgi:3'-5' exoribonuclease